MRLEKRTGIKTKIFEKIKFAVVKNKSFARGAMYLSDGKCSPPNCSITMLTILDDELWDKSADDDFLGLDHMNKQRTSNNAGQELTLK